jgi:hypothetical protein
MTAKRESSTRPSSRSPQLRQSPSHPAGDSPAAPPSSSPPDHVFAPEYLAWLAERDEPDTAAEADLAGPWHLERDPRGGWAVLRQGESLEKTPGLTPTATFDRKEIALLGAAILPGVGRDPRFRLAHDPDGRGQPILDQGRVVGHAEFFNEDFVAALSTVAALMASPRGFAFLLDAMGGLALEHVDAIAAARLTEPED